MKNYTMDQIEALKEWTVYGMIEGEQTFMQAFIEAVDYLELTSYNFTGAFQADCVEAVNEWKKNN